eukprot:Hpha_TRINITY_DN15228_c0_g1::TRINITY_DN15228_c0_g1_i1::g.68389::m.68389
MAQPAMLDPGALASVPAGTSPMGGRRTVTIIKTMGGPGGSPPVGQQRVFSHGPPMVQMPHRQTTPDPQPGWQVAVTGDLKAAQRSFEAANDQRVMGSAWMLTDDYMPFLGKSGVISEVAPGAVRVIFPAGPVGLQQGLWFPLLAITQMVVPHQGHSPPAVGGGGGVDFATAERLQAVAGLCDALPHHVLAATLRSVCESYPNLAAPVLQALHHQSQMLQQQQQLGVPSVGPHLLPRSGFPPGGPTPRTQGSGSSCSPPPPSPGQQREQDLHHTIITNGASPPRSPGRRLNPHSPPFTASHEKSRAQQEALRNAVDSHHEEGEAVPSNIADVVKGALGE